MIPGALRKHRFGLVTIGVLIQRSFNRGQKGVGLPGR